MEREQRPADAPVRTPEEITDALAGPLARGLTWLFETEQPEASLPAGTHFGESLAVPSVGRRLGFVPSGAESLPVVVVESTEYDSEYLGRPPTHGIAPGELEAVVRMITVVFGRAVRSTWNGHPFTSGSIGLADTAHSSLVAAMRYYSAGCPEHDGSVFCRCPWLHEAVARGVRL